MANTIGWGQGSANNENGWGKGGENSANGWGQVYANSPAGDTNIGVSSGSRGFTLDGIIEQTAKLDVNPPLTIPNDITFNGDGTEAYSCDLLQTTMEAWNLATPYDFTGATKGVSVNFSYNKINFIVFNNDGTKMYTQYAGLRDIRQYSCANPYDLTNITFEKVLTLINGPSYLSLWWQPNGLGVFMAVAGLNTIQKYNCSTPFDVGGINKNSFTSFDVTNDMTDPTCCALSPDGARMFVGTQTERRVYEYDLSSNFSLANPVLVRSMATPGQARGLEWSPDGMNLFVAQRFPELVYKYSLL